MVRLDPRAIERSTVIGISLFAASSIALQGFVVAQGSFSGRTSGMAQAAIVPPAEIFTAKADAAVPAEPAVATPEAARRGDLETAALPALARADRLSTGEELADTGSPRNAGEVAADTVLVKTATAPEVADPAVAPAPAAVAVSKATSTDAASAAKIGLRISTFGPAPAREPLAATQGVRSHIRIPQREVAIEDRQPGADAGQPRPTRVAYLASSARGLAGAMMKDRGAVIDVSPSAHRHRLSRHGRVPRRLVEKVHFQDHTPNRCLPNDLMDVIYDVAERFGEVQILSTFRDPDRNRRVGGAPRSFHLRCQAIDFRVIGRSAGLFAYLENRPEVGGLKRYPLGFYHIDTGPRRSW